jgi:hypothetical protein
MQAITQNEADSMWFGEIPFSVRMEIVDNWPVDLAVLLFRTQPNKPHSVWCRVHAAEVRNEGFVLDYATLNLKELMMREDAVNANECLSACEVLQARLKFNPYLLTSYATQKILKYFEMVRIICYTQKSIGELYDGEKCGRRDRNTEPSHDVTEGEGDIGDTNIKGRRRCIRRNGVEIGNGNGQSGL